MPRRFYISQRSGIRAVDACSAACYNFGPISPFVGPREISRDRKVKPRDPTEKVRSPYTHIYSQHKEGRREERILQRWVFARAHARCQVASWRGHDNGYLLTHREPTKGTHGGPKLRHRIISHFAVVALPFLGASDSSPSSSFSAFPWKRIDPINPGARLASPERRDKRIPLASFGGTLGRRWYIVANFGKMVCVLFGSYVLYKK